MARVLAVTIDGKEFGARVVNLEQETQDRGDIQGYGTSFVRLRIPRTPTIDSLQNFKTLTFRNKRFRILAWIEHAERVELDCEEDK